ncbi:helix-turn-helix domain-containing protein [Rhodovulum steppense]|uniref:Bacteriophage CI repressor-like protein n=1 Tax=Rhodovulum steppense TaxID=540251 RepID=A0A4R1YVM5_9RHOB|nr:helix-turn-helix domain-containing protein [Rhodovulum steppense]TCM84803.1 bacteriophage CI repressor-like protein [Rhodovulum steppense]
MAMFIMILASDGNAKSRSEWSATETGDTSAAAVVIRMKQALNILTDTSLAEHLGLSKNTVSTWISRKSVPYEAAVKVAIEAGVSLDFLLLGRDTP